MKDWAEITLIYFKLNLKNRIFMWAFGNNNQSQEIQAFSWTVKHSKTLMSDLCIKIQKYTMRGSRGGEEETVLGVTWFYLERLQC